MKTIGWITTTIVALVITNIWRGYVLVKLWKWFILGSLSTVALSIPQAIGISIITGYLTARIARTKTEDKKPWADDFAESIVVGLLLPAYAWLFGWTVHSFL